MPSQHCTLNGIPTHPNRSPERGVRTAESPSRSCSPQASDLKPEKLSKTSTEPSREDQASNQGLRNGKEPKATLQTLRAAGLSLKSLLGEYQENRKRREITKNDAITLRLREGAFYKRIDLHNRLDCRQFDEKRLDCPEELYNLTKLAEVSLAAAAGHVFCKRLSPQPEKSSVPIQEYPEDLSRDTVDRDEHPCSDCGKRYSTSSNLARHRQTHRSLADKKARKCPHCDKVYVSMPAFAMHMRTHNQGCRCPFCGKCFSRPWLLQGHIRTHTGEKPFQCSICHKSFADKSNLRAHVQTHSSLKPHVCTRCGKAFALKSYLYKHEESSCMKAPCDQVGTSTIKAVHLEAR